MNDEKQNEKTNLSIPGAIIVVGVLIAGAILFSNNKNGATDSVNNAQLPSSNISIKPINSNDHILGDPNAPIVIVEFSDTECPYCKMFQSTMENIMNTYGKNGTVAWVYRDLPLNIHPLSEKESEALECATSLGGNTAFWKFEKEIYATTTSNNTLDPAVLPIIAKDIGINVAAFNTCLSNGTYTSTVQTSISEAENAGAQGTPYNVMILKTPLTSDKINTLETYAASNNLSQNISISSDNKEIVLNGAIPLTNITFIIDTITK